MENEPKPATKAPAWPLETLDGARLIMEATAALMGGQGALCYLKPGVEGFRLLAGPLMDDAEALAAGAMSRSEARAARGPLRQFFRRRDTEGHGPCGVCQNGILIPPNGGCTECGRTGDK